jgi:hypothetical protein
MKTTFPFTVAIVVALCADLLLPLPKYAAAGLERANSEYARSCGDPIQQQIVSKEPRSWTPSRPATWNYLAICWQMMRCSWTHRDRE